MDIPATLDTAKFRQLVLQGIESLSGGGGGGASSTNTAVGPDGVTRVPLQVNSDGELKVNVEASIDADLAQIENKLDTIIGIETPQAADVAAIKTKLNNSIAVTGTFFQATQPVSGTVTANTGLTQPLTDTQLRATAVPISGTVTTNAGTNLNTSALALESGGNLASIATNTANLLPKTGSLTMTNSSVGTSSATLLAASSATRVLAIQNTSANILYVSTTTPATATNGILLSAGQGYEFAYVPSNTLYALGSAASTTYTLWYA